MTVAATSGRDDGNAKRIFEWLITIAVWVFGAGIAYSQIAENAKDIAEVDRRLNVEAQQLGMIRAEIAAIKSDSRGQSRDIQRILEILERRYASQ